LALNPASRQPAPHLHAGYRTSPSLLRWACSLGRYCTDQLHAGVVSTLEFRRQSKASQARSIDQPSMPNW
jgi:hypothetical protein